MISLKQLEALQCIAQLGTFKRAAAKLNTTQSAISKRMQQLEQTLQISIFDRSDRGARLTGQGENLLALAQEMLAIQQRILDLHCSEKTPARRLRLGVTELSALTWLPLLISEIRLRFPFVTIEPEVGIAHQLHEGLLDDRLDLIVVPPATISSELTVVPLGNVKIAWMAKPGLVKPKRTLTLAEVSQHPVVIPSRKSGSGGFLNKWLKEQGVIFSNVLLADHFTALVGLAVAGFGIVFMPLKLVQPLVKEKKLEVLRVSPTLPPIPYAALYRNDRPSAFIASIAELTQEVADFSSQL